MKAPVKILKQLYNMIKSLRLVFKLHITASMENLKKINWNTKRARSLVVSNLHLQTKGSQFKSGC